MSDETGSDGGSRELKTPNNDRIIMILGVLTVAGTVIGGVLGNFRFGIAILVGGGLALANYFWLRHSLKAIFAVAAKGERPRMISGTYFLRYIVLGAVVALIYASEILPIVPVVMGFAGLGFAVIVEAVIRVTKSIFGSREN